MTGLATPFGNLSPMRALKTLLIILLAVAAFALLLGLFGPKRSQFERTTTIGAPAAVVWEHVKTLKAADRWSPFLAMDTAAVVTYEGTDGAVGSKSAWTGEKVGKGEQTISAADPGNQVDVDLHFLEPFEGLAKASVKLVPQGDSTHVSWSYDGENGFISRIICVFKDMDSMLGPVFADGLARLKTMAENDAARMADDVKSRTFGGYTINTVERPAMTYLGKRQTVKWENFGTYFASTFPAAAQAATTAGFTMQGHPSALVYHWDTVAHSADLFAGMPVGADTSKSATGFIVQTVPAGKVLTVAYYGNYDLSQRAHDAIDDMMKANGIELRDAVIEEYVTDPTSEPDTAKWLTNIYYPIK